MNRRLVERVDRLLSLEKGTIVKDHGGKIPICLVYPNTYHVGMSNLGFQGVYGLLNRYGDVVCERAFLPSEDVIEEHVRTGTPIFSFETKRPLNSFPIVAFSLSFENDYPNVLRILEIAKIPFSSSERTAYHPLLIAGGVCISSNPEPLSPFFDIIFIGEAEEALDEFLAIYRETSGRGDHASHRQRVRREALSIEGLYVPEFYRVAYGESGTIAERRALTPAPEKVGWRRMKDLSRSPVTMTITTPETEFSSMYLIEVMRGCPWNCRFCLVGHVYGLPRKKTIDSLSEEIGKAKEEGAQRIGLIGPSLTDYPHIEDILCLDGVRFSITSLRASAGSARLVELLRRNKTVSIAPEAGTERLRKVIRKRITEEDIFETAKLILQGEIEHLRLYFMVGLPTENMEDIAGMVKLVGDIRALSQRGEIVLSISTFVPKPFTPFQWHPMERLNSVKEKMKFIRKGLRGLKGVRVFHDVPKYAHMQGLFSLGDRRVSKVLEAMSNADDWIKACTGAGLDPEFYLYRSKGPGEALPWDFIDAGLEKKSLWEDYTAALTG